MVAAVVVRRAVADDADGLARAHVRAWQVGYASIMPREFLDGLDPGALGAWWATTLAGSGTARAEAPAGQRPGEVGDPEPPASTVLVAVRDGVVAGFASYGPYRPAAGATTGGEPVPTPEPAASELWALNVDPAAWGTGVAQALMASCVSALQERVERRAVLWVLEENHRGRRFYEKEGWTADGASQVDTIGGVALVELRYALDW